MDDIVEILQEQIIVNKNNTVLRLALSEIVKLRDKLSWERESHLRTQRLHAAGQVRDG